MCTIVSIYKQIQESAYRIKRYKQSETRLNTDLCKQAQISATSDNISVALVDCTIQLGVSVEYQDKITIFRYCPKEVWDSPWYSGVAIGNNIFTLYYVSITFLNQKKVIEIHRSLYYMINRVLYNIFPCYIFQRNNAYYRPKIACKCFSLRAVYF